MCDVRSLYILFNYLLCAFCVFLSTPILSSVQMLQVATSLIISFIPYLKWQYVMLKVSKKD